ncbi:MAG: FlgD immunoglobulin-like domain containing protein [Ignavibacteriaceae bacterium]|jgi:hypothetical protein
MKKIITFLGILLYLGSGISSAQTVIFTEDFESGSADAAWATYYKNEDKLVAKPMANAPKALATGGNYVGLLQDADGTYTGSAVAVTGDVALKDYSIEADVYCYVNQALSAYSGLVTYADSSKKDFYKMRVDFDATNRINFSGLKSDPNTFLPVFNKDFKGVDNVGLFPTTDGWYKLKVEVRTINDSTVKFWCYFNNQLLTGCPIERVYKGANTSGGFGLYSFQQGAAGLAAYFDNIVVTQLAPVDPPSTVIFTENFESGSADASWATYYKNEDKLVAKPMANAPQALATGGNYVGLLQDIDGTYTGSAVATAGALSLKDYSIEADVYCYVNQSLSAYSGLVVYADSSKKDFYKMRVDFDATNRINFSGLKSDPNTFLPVFNKDFKGVDNVGLFPTTDGWYKVKVEVRTINDSTVKFWCYFNNQLLTGCPIERVYKGANTSGGFGLYSFQQSTTGLAAYFDNIVVSQLAPLAVEDNAPVPVEYILQQNYPNPFNPSTTINYNLPTSGLVSLNVYDLLGREVASLVSTEQSAGHHSATWNGKNNSGNAVPSGVYLYSLSSGNYKSTMKMILMK